MKLLLFCLATLITTTLAAVDVEKTVKQVQTILQANSQLPRLTRDEIIELLNHIRAEDSTSKSISTEKSSEIKEDANTKPYNVHENEISSTSDLQDNNVADKNKVPVYATAPTTQTVEVTTKREPTVMVVLPYTPRDGSSLQELYTRPPRVEVVPESKVTPRPLNENEKLKETLNSNAKLANQNKLDLPTELQAFLDSHGLKGKPGQDSFLLPLDGFKPLPPAKIVDGTVQLPENILLTYDLITPSDSNKSSDNVGLQSMSPHNFLYEPLRPEFPFELDTSSSEQEKLVLPLDMPKSRKTKTTTSRPNYAPIDYDAIKVIPLNKGPNPIEDERAVIETDQSKRQASSTESPMTAEAKEVTTSSSSENTRDAITNAPSVADSAAADSDSGASITDLEDSFGGAAPSQPGDSEIPPPKKNGFYWMVDWNSFLEVGDGDTKVNIRFEPKLGDPQMFLPVNVP